MSALEIVVTVLCLRCNLETSETIPFNAGRGDIVALTIEFPQEHRCATPPEVIVTPGMPTEAEGPRETKVLQTYRGWLYASTPDETGVRFLGLRGDPRGDGDLVDLIGDDARELNLWQWSVRYFVATEERTLDQLTETLVRRMAGEGQAYSSEGHFDYSELTPGNAAVEKFTVGGHDLLQELWGHCGKFLHLEIEMTARAGG